MNHYCCFQFFIPERKGTRISATAKIFLAHSKVPNISSTDSSIAAENNLLKALQHQSLALQNLKPETSYYNALKQLEKTYNTATTKIK